MKGLKTILGVVLATTGFGGAVAIGAKAVSNMNNTNIEIAEAADTYWWVRGSMNSWTGNDSYKIKQGGDPLILDLAANAEFKVVSDASSWSGVTELTTSNGDASGKGITFSSGSNSKVNTAGKYAFSVKKEGNNTNLYVDFGEFYYSGTTNSWGTDTSTTGNHPKVLLNGSSVTYTLSANEEFKLRNNNWDKGVFGYSNLKDSDFYGSFESSNGNIKCKVAGKYDVTISMTNRTWTVRIVPNGVNPDDTDFVYVLDKYGTNLNDYHNAHIYNASGQTMTWPGATMQTYTGTTHMYKQEFWVGMEKVIFNNKHGDGNNEGTQSIAWDISGASSKAGKCLILDNSIENGEWSSSTWVAPETAKFIENCMHFANYNEEQGGSGECLSQSWYTIAKNAYNASSFSSFRAELCSLDYVVERLQAWAAANGDSFNISNGTGTFSSRPMNEISKTISPVVLLITLSVISSIATLGYFILLKKKKQ